MSQVVRGAAGHSLAYTAHEAQFHHREGCACPPSHESTFQTSIQRTDHGSDNEKREIREEGRQEWQPTANMCVHELRLGYR